MKMAIGKFNEIDNKKNISETKNPKESKYKKDIDRKETKETRGPKESSKFPKNQILQTPESCRNNFKKKMEQNVAKKNDAGKERKTDKEKKTPEKKKIEIFKGLFEKKEGKETGKVEQKNSEKTEKVVKTGRERRKEFVAQLRDFKNYENTNNKKNDVQKKTTTEANGETRGQKERTIWDEGR